MSLGVSRQVVPVQYVRLHALQNLSSNSAGAFQAQEDSLSIVTFAGKNKPAKLKKIAMVGLMALSMLGLGAKSVSASGIQSVPDSNALILAGDMASNPIEMEQSQTQSQVAITASMVNSAADVPAVPAGSTQHIIDLAGAPLLNAETHAFINAQLEAVSQAGYSGDIYMVVVPDTTRDVMQLAQEINQKLNPEGDGGVVILNARALREHHSEVPHVRTWTTITCTRIGKINSCTPQTHHSVTYPIQPAMLQALQGYNMFRLGMAGNLERAEGQFAASEQDYRDKMTELQQMLHDNPEALCQTFSAYYNARLQNARNAQGSTIYAGDFNQVARNLASELRALYENPIYQYARSEVDKTRFLQIVLISLAIGSTVLGGAYVVDKARNKY